MNDQSILYYPIGEVTEEKPLLEQLKGIIADEAMRLVCVGGDTWYLGILINAYRLAKEGY